MIFEITSRKVLRESESSHRIVVDLYLPSEPLKRLDYLTKFLNTEFPPSPFSEKQGKIFKESRRWEWINNRTMGGCLLVCAALAVVGVILQTKSVQHWANATPQNDSAIFSLGAVISVFGVVIGYVATGNIPDMASATSDKETRDFDRIKEIYVDIAFRLLETYEMSPIEADRIARALDVKKIQAAMQSLISEEDAEEICEPIKFARDAVIHGAVSALAPPAFRMKWSLIKTG